MGANKWSKCPMCEKRRDDKVKELEAAAAAQYGKVSVDEFDELRSKADLLRDSELPETYREDWGIGLDEDTGSVVVDYRSSCKLCSAHCEFQASHEVIA
ncbi:hypothetical protein HQO24_10260 [Rhodococcus fascians]|nr:hypothetical protein [Rhodococcus fascians]MBY4396937.1 hypothetical protein [Rhodococcus fascians]MBY4407416.1 hypothetical protein [Rhodococcus fascians]MBY4421455.1 hypothetical protein [Rhodococcus fascians]MBY4460792.1 hypothetical protein [Rhodococcus fascians]